MSEATPTLTTSRLVLRSFRSDDVDPLRRVLGEPGVLRYFPNTERPDRARVSKLVAHQLEHWREHGYGWVVWPAVPP
jgi:RimJ/RimL family protein N-acetyltransferase